MSYYRTCPRCGCNLDPGERCDCESGSRSRVEGRQATFRGDNGKIPTHETRRHAHGAFAQFWRGVCNMEDERKIFPPPLNQIPAADLQRMKRDGLGNLYAPMQAETEALEKIIRKAWDLFYDDFMKDGSPIVSTLFTWDGETSTGDFEPSNDAICCCWEDHAGIGIEKAAFSHENLENYLALLLLHELTHLLVEGDHTADYENYLSYLIIAYNRAYGTNLVNDFSGYSGSLKKDQRRADSQEVPSTWISLFSGIKGHRSDGKKTATQKKRKSAIDDSSQSARRAMIQRMKQQDKQTASEKSQIRKDYNGSHKE